MRKIFLKVTPNAETIKKDQYVQIYKQTTILQDTIHNKQKQRLTTRIIFLTPLWQIDSFPPEPVCPYSSALVSLYTRLPTEGYISQTPEQLVTALIKVLTNRV